MLEGILHQVVENLLDPCFIGPDRARLGRIEQQSHSGALRVTAEPVDEVGRQFRQPEFARFQ